jgi:hypothetical protein
MLLPFFLLIKEDSTKFVHSSNHNLQEEKMAAIRNRDELKNMQLERLHSADGIINKQLSKCLDRCNIDR